MVVLAVSLADAQTCVKQGEHRIDVGRSFGHLFYARTIDQTSTVAAGPSSPLPASYFTSVPTSSSPGSQGLDSFISKFLALGLYFEV